jgi:hypothetical protein
MHKHETSVENSILDIIVHLDYKYYITSIHNGEI